MQYQTQYLNAVRLAGLLGNSTEELGPSRSHEIRNDVPQRPFTTHLPVPLFI